MLPQGCFVRASTGITMFSPYVEEYEPLGDNTSLVKELALYGVGRTQKRSIASLTHFHLCFCSKITLCILFMYLSNHVNGLKRVTVVVYLKDSLSLHHPSVPALHLCLNASVFACLSVANSQKAQVCVGLPRWQCF